MQLNLLSIFHLRNLEAVELALNPHFNIFWGENGGGKTSLLEAIYLLGTGRSFRVTQTPQIISFGKDACQVSGLVAARDLKSGLSPIRMGVERLQSGGINIRLGEKDGSSIAQLAQTLPLQLINSESYAILEASPERRREFMDWILFHVEPSFYPAWQRFKRALQQRNAALKGAKSVPAANIRAWDRELIETGERIATQRRAILTELKPLFLEALQGLLELQGEVLVEYESGYESELSLEEALDRAFSRDMAWGYTTVGPQRADLKFLVSGVLAKNLLSRGQLKLFICALLMARANLLYLRQQRRCVFLIDDLCSELDARASGLLLEALFVLGGQVLVTCIDNTVVNRVLADKEHAMFGVKAGVVG